ncbi:MAG: hypothetical protein D6704_04065 [Nitrospirae bacterium]|nr:MAG: hypothetical protein D6704_04065 [Nitrospirota bacterium]
MVNWFIAGLYRNFHNDTGGASGLALVQAPFLQPNRSLVQVFPVSPWVRICRLVSLLVLLWASTVGLAWEPCRMDTGEDPSRSRTMFVRHLRGHCSAEDRKAFAVPAGSILDALKDGYGVDLDGVVVTGDLMLDRLPLEPVPLNRISAAFVRDRFQAEHVTRVYIIHGPFRLRHAEVHGILATNLYKRGYLVVMGPFDLTGTRFHRSIDFSRTVFLDSVDVSGAVIAYEAFFIRALFLDRARFEKTAFGTHTRFYKAVFGDRVAFTRAGFNGLAEFLEVTFQQDASFSRTRFVMGTGFSGSRFTRGLDFSEATFDREAFFRFTAFEGDAYFRRTVFHNVADFTQAQFRGISDFTKVRFAKPPQLAGTSISLPESTQLAGLHDPQILTGVIIATLVILGIVLVLFYRRESE